jgi:restriction system protein
MSTSSYWVDVKHEGLHTYRRITGRDKYVVEAKAAAQRAAWGEKWARMQSKEKALYTKEQKKESAAHKTLGAAESLAGIENTLNFGIERGISFSWESLKENSNFQKPAPSEPVKQKPPVGPLRAESKYQVRFSLLDHLFAKRKQKRIDESTRLFEEDVARWKSEAVAVDLRNSTADSEFHAAFRRWEQEKAEFYASQDSRNREIDAHKAAYLDRQPDAVVDYCDLVLTASEYPDNFPKSWRIDYKPEVRLLIVEYSLPNSDAIPRLKEVKYVQSRDEFTESYLSDSSAERIYDALLYKITLRSIHELVYSDLANAIDSIVLNGWVRAIDSATGQETNGCILSIQVNRGELATINLAKVDPKACFKKLRGVGSSKLAALVPVRPILQLDTEDERFVPSYKVEDSIDSTMNLAAMDWEDFEHLIREVFEKEFSNDGGEVKITRASRDGGVDAMVFDPDPLRGGKIVIQAKRYTNTVGVSAVRDLYGTVVNEGANKGILVTTADYGPDAYDFAKDKPLTLLSGSNLLHLLAKHGHQARIDLKEAKQILQNAAK